MPRQAFQVGDVVQTLVGEVDGSVVRTKTVAKVINVHWHSDRGRWIYYLDRRRARWRRRWYVAENLALVKPAEDAG